ncbi:hypothetical protein D3C81_1914140 [compost metagenome]
MVLHPFPAAKNMVLLPFEQLPVVLNISLYLRGVAPETLQTPPLKPKSLLYSPVQHICALLAPQSLEKIQPDLQPCGLLLKLSAGAQPSEQSGK